MLRGNGWLAGGVGVVVGPGFELLEGGVEFLEEGKFSLADVEFDADLPIVECLVDDFGLGGEEGQQLAIAGGGLDEPVEAVGLNFAADAFDQEVETLAGFGGNTDGVGGHCLDDGEDAVLVEHVDFVQEGELGFIFASQFVEDGTNGLVLEIGYGAGGIDDVQEEVGVNDFFEGGAERGDKMVREVADEPDGVADDGAFAETEGPFAGFGIEGGEQFVFDQDARSG